MAAQLVCHRKPSMCITLVYSNQKTIANAVFSDLLATQPANDCCMDLFARW